MNKVIVRIRGGLGNQLFCYAAARRLALVNNAELVLDDVTGFIRDYQYRRLYALDFFNIVPRKASPSERMEPLERYRRFLVKWRARRQPFHERNYLEQQGMGFEQRLLDFRVNGTVHIDGLWQSEKYFNDVEDVIRTDLSIVNPPTDASNRSMAERILSENSVAVHLRFFEAFGNAREKSTYNLEGTYYARAVEMLAGRLSHPHFFVFSDDPAAARQVFKLHSDTTFVDHNSGDQNACADLWLMSRCRHFIIANSTFSWWAAWLASNPSKIIISPKIVTGGLCSWGFEGLIPNSWIEL